MKGGKWLKKNLGCMYTFHVMYKDLWGIHLDKQEIAYSFTYIK